MTNRKVKNMYGAYLNASDPEHKLEKCTATLNEYDKSIFVRNYIRMRNNIDDIKLFTRHFRYRKTIDNSTKRRKDYYSVAVIVKNAARYMKEFVLFYQATGADRIYIYDNESTDDLLSVLEPFIKSGLVVYRYWPGKIVQTAAYRDAVRRTKKRTKWLAIVDADEFLFSPKGSMPEHLKNFEKYPGIGVNWVLFGPNGHDRRPEGLVMDNYTSTIAYENTFENCHIKSIVQPAEVYTVSHTHYPIYKHGKFAVDENGESIDNKCSFVYASGKAFTYRNHREIFRINHYITKSLEDLEEKCMRGYADGALNAKYDRQLLPFENPVVYDYSIRKYANLVRKSEKD